jgi:uncharacterized protein YecA (UPF0149 family)
MSYFPPKEEDKNEKVKLLPQKLPALPSKVTTDHGPVSKQFRANARIGPNAPCACGSTRKYKKCCGTRI